MIERVVENWLTSANERQYQLPFCQLLASEGETIVYISRHGQREQGKDIITRGRHGGVRAYQLKQGHLSLADWRTYKGELDELVRYPPSHPSVISRKVHAPFLVTNGTVSDPVLDALKSANRDWARNRSGPLKLVEGPELVSRFVRAHGRFLPQDPKEFNRLLELIVGSGQSPLDKNKFAKFLESILPIKNDRDLPGRFIQRSVASAALPTSYVTQGYERKENH